jgi:hypothetical protein
MIWGVLPTKQPISWEGHLSGFVAGILVALFYRNEGPKRKKYQWEIDEEIEEKLIEENQMRINYILKKEDKSN